MKLSNDGEQKYLDTDGRKSDIGGSSTDRFSTKKSEAIKPSGSGVKGGMPSIANSDINASPAKMKSRYF